MLAAALATATPAGAADEADKRLAQSVMNREHIDCAVFIAKALYPATDRDYGWLKNPYEVVCLDARHFRFIRGDLDKKSDGLLWEYSNVERLDTNTGKWVKP